MFHTHLTSKGQVTVPQRFRRRMKLTGRRSVTVDQLSDGSVIIRPTRSVLDLAGKLKLNRPLLSPEEERREAEKAVARRNAEKLRGQ